MKHIKILGLLLVVGFLGILSSCSEDEEIQGALVIQTGLLKNVMYTSALCGGEISGGAEIGERGVCWSTAEHPTVTDAHTSDGKGRGEFLSEMSGLQEGTLYYVRAYAYTNEGIQYGDEKWCVTLAKGRPTLAMVSVTDVKTSSAIVKAEVFTDGGTEITERGFVYALSSAVEGELTLENAGKVKVDGKVGTLKCMLEELIDHSEYVCRAYVSYTGGTVYAQSLYFMTEMFPEPAVEITSIDDIRGESFQVSVKAVSGTPLPILEYGFVYGEVAVPTLEDTKVVLGEGDGEKSYKLEGLEQGITYQVRPYARNKNGVVYGEIQSVTTLSYKAIISTQLSAHITAHRAYAGGEVTSTGLLNAPIIEAGICWGTAHNPTIAGNKVMAEGVDGEHLKFEPLQLFPLNPNTTYYVRAYVTNEYGTTYGEEENFKTRQPVADYFKAEASKEDNPLFNALNLTADFLDKQASADQIEAYNKLVPILTSYGSRILKAYRISLGTNSSKDLSYIYTSLEYENSSGKAYSAIWRSQLAVNANYQYTVSHHAINTGNNNASNIINSAAKNGQTEDLERSMNYLTEGPFVIDWDTESSTTFNSAFYIIPLNAPEKYKRMEVYRNTKITVYDPWW